MYILQTFGTGRRREAVLHGPPLAGHSAEELLGEEFATVMFAHGPVLRSGGKAALRDAVDRCSY